MYSVTVLTPGGRRQQVKVTPNTTILQILEEVCTKHGFNAQEYDLSNGFGKGEKEKTLFGITTTSLLNVSHIIICGGHATAADSSVRCYRSVSGHHNKVLDISSMFRFTSLPNNAQLEMTEAVRRRQESPVTLGLQFESGERLTGTFSPSDSVWKVIITLKPEEEKSSNLVVIYMRNEIFGNENLKLTSLRSLGLTGGRAMLRVLHKSPEELRFQANVSSILMPRVAVEEKNRKSPEVFKKEVPRERPKTPKPPSPNPLKKEPGSPTATKKEVTSAKYKSDNFNLRGNVFENLLKDEKTRRSLAEGGNREAGSATRKEPLPEKKTAPERKVEKKATWGREVQDGQEAKVILLGERNAVAYNLNSVKPVTYEEESDDFYDLTVNDAQLLMKQAKQLCADLEEAPLMTSAQREFEKDKKVLSLLHQHKKTVLRVKFPDRTVLQGIFAPLETVSAVEKFVAGYLENPSLRFYLYTTPPKVILNSEDRLIECGCVPCSVLYFGMPPEVSPPSQYLKSEVLQKLSTPSGAALQAYEARGIEKPETYKIPEEGEKRKWKKNTSVPEAGPSGSQQWEEKPRDHESSPQFKVPKWFKTNK